MSLNFPSHSYQETWFHSSRSQQQVSTPIRSPQYPRRVEPITAITSWWSIRA